MEVFWAEKHNYLEYLKENKYKGIIEFLQFFKIKIGKLASYFLNLIMTNFSSQFNTFGSLIFIEFTKLIGITRKYPDRAKRT